MYGYRDKNLEFLQDKINSIRIALFKPEIYDELVLPNAVINTLYVDNSGTVWFFLSANKLQVSMITQPFHANLEYYKKDTRSRLTVSGVAVNAELDMKEDNELKEIAGNYPGVLLKMKILHAEFDENAGIEQISWPQKIKTVFHHFFPSVHKEYNFS